MTSDFNALRRVAAELRSPLSIGAMTPWALPEAWKATC